jgi:high-affinity Fe2+/Pb2+ permease
MMVVVTTVMVMLLLVVMMLTAFTLLESSQILGWALSRDSESADGPGREYLLSVCALTHSSTTLNSPVLKVMS